MQLNEATGPSDSGCRLRNTDESRQAISTRLPGGDSSGKEDQYSRIENGKVEPAVSTLEKLAKVFDASVSEFFRSDNLEDELNLPVLEKIKLIDALGKNEQQAIFTMIDMAISNKKLKDNLQSLITQ